MTDYTDARTVFRTRYKAASKESGSEFATEHEAWLYFRSQGWEPGYMIRRKNFKAPLSRDNWRFVRLSLIGPTELRDWDMGPAVAYEKARRNFIRQLNEAGPKGIDRLVREIRNGRCWQRGK